MIQDINSYQTNLKDQNQIPPKSSNASEASLSQKISGAAVMIASMAYGALWAYAVHLNLLDEISKTTASYPLISYRIESFGRGISSYANYKAEQEASNVSKFWFMTAMALAVSLYVRNSGAGNNQQTQILPQVSNNTHLLENGPSITARRLAADNRSKIFTVSSNFPLMDPTGSFDI